MPILMVSMELQNKTMIVIRRFNEAGKMMSRTVLPGDYSLCLDLADTLQLNEVVQSSDYSRWEG